MGLPPSNLLSNNNNHKIPLDVPALIDKESLSMTPLALIIRNASRGRGAAGDGIAAFDGLGSRNVLVDGERVGAGIGCVVAGADEILERPASRGLEIRGGGEGCWGADCAGDEGGEEEDLRTHCSWTFLIYVKDDLKVFLCGENCKGKLVGS